MKYLKLFKEDINWDEEFEIQEEESLNFDFLIGRNGNYFYVGVYYHINFYLLLDDGGYDIGWLQDNISDIDKENIIDSNIGLRINASRDTRNKLIYYDELIKIGNIYFIDELNNNYNDYECDKELLKKYKSGIIQIDKNNNVKIIENLYESIDWDFEVQEEDSFDIPSFKVGDTIKINKVKYIDSNKILIIPEFGDKKIKEIKYFNKGDKIIDELGQIGFLDKDSYLFKLEGCWPWFIYNDEMDFKIVKNK